MRQFCEFLITNGIAKNEHYLYQKWLRYYLDFCHKYQFIEADPDSLPCFVQKLHEKNQSMYQQEPASHAIGLYYELISSNPPTLPKPDKSPEVLEATAHKANFNTQPPGEEAVSNIELMQY